MSPFNYLGKCLLAVGELALVRLLARVRSNMLLQVGQLRELEGKIK
jgi:hypothetical protein